MRKSKTSTHIGVFAKYWTPGNVKTRLAASIGSKNAANLYREFIRQTLYRLDPLDVQKSIWVTPPEKIDAFHSLAPADWNVHLQSDGDLGKRMLGYFQDSFQSVPDRQKVIFVGSDTPDLPPSLVQSAIAALDDHDCVIGPSRDGGYYLIGMSRVISELFENVAWSTPDVLPQTLQIVKDISVTCHQLDHWNDIDDQDDLNALQQSLQSLDPRPEIDQALLDAIQVATR